jgi:hypothetical protein
VSRRFELGTRTGDGDGYRDDLPLRHDLEQPIVVEASALGRCHPMFTVRLKLFLDWHRAAGHDVRLVPPDDPSVIEHLANMGIASSLPEQMTVRFPAVGSSPKALLPVRRLATSNDVEDVSWAVTEALGQLSSEFAVWSDPVYMAVSELCSNALQHGRDELGAYVAADRIDGERHQFRLAIADLGIGIPEFAPNRR